MQNLNNAKIKKKCTTKKVVQKLLQNGRMTDDQFKQLGQMALQILKIGRF